MKVEDLPFKEYPFISEFQILQDIEIDQDNVKKTGFKDNIIRIPFFIFFKINEVEGQGSIRIQLYNKADQMVYKKQFEYGKKDKYYEYIILWDRIENIRPEDLYCTIFYKKDLIRAAWIKIDFKKKGDDKNHPPERDNN